MEYTWKNNDTYLPYTDMVLRYGKRYDLSSVKTRLGEYFKITDPESGESTYMRYASLVKFRRDWRAA